MEILQVTKTKQPEVYITHQAQANEERSDPYRKNRIPIVPIDYTTVEINKQGKLVGRFYKLLITLLLWDQLIPQVEYNSP